VTGLRLPDPGHGDAPRGGVAASPPRQARPYRTFLVRDLARRHGIDLDAVRGSGPRGRVRPDDVRQAARAAQAAAARSVLVEVFLRRDVAGATEAVHLLTTALAAHEARVVPAGGDAVTAALAPAAHGELLVTVGAVTAVPVVVSEGIAVGRRLFVGISIGPEHHGAPTERLAELVRVAIGAPSVGAPQGGVPSGGPRC